MSDRSFAVTGVLSLHREAELLRPSFHSLLRALRALTARDISWEMLCVLDRPDAVTRSVIGEELQANVREGESIRTVEVDVGDLGLSRNAAVEASRGEYIGFLDGDDLCSGEWMGRAYEHCRKNPSIIAHPEVNICFGRHSAVFVHPNQSAYDLRALFFHNLWTALSFAPRELYRTIPYTSNEVTNGLGYEDWNWNCRTIEAGWRHGAVPQSAHFIRLKEPSLALGEETKRNSCVIKRVSLWQRLAASLSTPSTVEREQGKQQGEVAELLANDPDSIELVQLPDWLKTEINLQSPSLGIEGSLYNFSPLNKNPFVEVLTPSLLKAVADGFEEIHFARSSVAEFPRAERSLLIADSCPWEEVSDNVLSLEVLASRLRDKLTVFLGMLFVQSGCRRIHLWDSEEATGWVCRFGAVLSHQQVRIHWHQLVPGASPPAPAIENGRLREGWVVVPHTVDGGQRVPFGLEAPRQQRALSILYLVDCPRIAHPWAQQSVWYRVIGPGEALRLNGHQVFYGLLEEREKWELLIRGRGCDMVLLHRGTESVEFDELRSLTERYGIPLVYEFDDNIISPGHLPEAAHLQGLPREKLAEVQLWAAGNARCLGACDAAITATEELCTLAKSVQPLSFVFDNFIPGFFRSFEVPARRDQRRVNHRTIFYGPGSKEHSAYLASITGDIADVMDRRPDVTFVLGGGLEVPAELRRFEKRIVSLPKLAPQFYLRYLESVDVVLAPLSLDVFSRCKSWIKALEAAAVGAEWIGSELPGYGRFAKETGTGTIVKNGASWAQDIQCALDRIAESGRRPLPAQFRAWMNERVGEYELLLAQIAAASKPELRRSEPLAISVERGSTVTAVDSKVSCQIFWSGDEDSFTESRSTRRELDAHGVATVTFDLDEALVSKVRIDPAETPGTFEILEVVVRSRADGRVLFRADERGGWSQVRSGGTSSRIADRNSLLIASTGLDPQLYLPYFEPALTGLEIRMVMKFPSPGVTSDSAAGKGKGAFSFAPALKKLSLFRNSQ